jgi:ribonuclease BN (tRNA processing enzyme)
MRFTVLGKSPAWQDAGGACSGYLVEQDDHRVLVDCGNGVFAKLRERLDPGEVDEVFLSHFHADHFLDLVPFSYALTLGPGAAGRRKPLLHVPEGVQAKLAGLVGAWGNSGLIEAAFEVREYETAGTLELGPLHAGLHPVPHFALTHALELHAPGGERLVYGADCRFDEALIEAARGAAVLLAESTLAEPSSEPLSEQGHMSPPEAGELARRAGVGRLVLTHISDQLDTEASRRDAAAAFGGPVEVAAEGMSFELD